MSGAYGCLGLLAPMRARLPPHGTGLFVVSHLPGLRVLPVALGFTPVAAFGLNGQLAAWLLPDLRSAGD